MKIEIGESFCYSYLRHVKQCWLVQTNWKASEQWIAQTSDDEIESMFQSMKQRFDGDGDVFKQTNIATQFMKQGEIDVVGIDQKGNIHAMDVAFHEFGLNYNGGVANNVLKKMLRAHLLLDSYISTEAKYHIYFVSPKVNPKDRQQLEDVFKALREEYSETEWHLTINDDFTKMMQETLARATSVADTSELFVRASKLLNITGTQKPNVVNAQTKTQTRKSSETEAKIQPIVEGLMQTLLKDHPTLLDEEDIQNLMDADYCKKELGLRIGNFSLLRTDRSEKYRVRYWKDLYAGKFYVCSQWGKPNHTHNAKSLLRFAQDVATKRPNNPGTSALNEHMKALSDYINSQ